MYDFQIPDAVVRTALRKIDFISIEHHQYTVTDLTKLNDYNLEVQQYEMLEKNNHILEKLYAYIEQESRNILTSEISAGGLAGHVEHTQNAIGYLQGHREKRA